MKSISSPAGGDNVAARLKARVDTNSTGPVPAQAQATAETATEKPARSRGTEMDRRSWYMPKDSADALAELVEQLYWETRQPKQAILAAVVDEVLARRAQVERRLGKR
ncbi:hypothetical protein ABZX88_35390 [Kitasatospora aureofaciens]|uniref:hypothetical protein n=1 Tax=Kitasatospora aureofaciens TaxID=1894 RepID=UPI0033AAA981